MSLTGRLKIKFSGGLHLPVDGRRLRVGDRGDLVVLGADPQWEGDPAATHAHLLAMPVRATVCAGRITHRAG